MPSASRAVQMTYCIMPLACSDPEWEKMLIGDTVTGGLEEYTLREFVLVRRELLLEFPDVGRIFIEKDLDPGWSVRSSSSELGVEVNSRCHNRP